MGELVQFDGGLPEKPNATVGQALYAAIVDELAALGTALPPRLIATAAKQGKEALQGGVQAEIVLAGCITALCQGKARYTADIIGDLCLASVGAHMTPQEYRHFLSMKSRANNDAVSNVRAVAEGLRERKQLEEGS